MNESTLAILALSHSTCAQLMNDLEAMKDGEEQYVVTSHKEERHTCIKADAADRIKSIYIDVESDKHLSMVLLTYFLVELFVDDAAVNVHNYDIVEI